MTAGTKSQRRVLLGHISGAVGIRGEVLIKSHTANPGDIGRYGPLSDAKGERTLEISVVRTSNKGVVARIGGVATRTEAEKLKGCELYVDREKLPEPAAGEFYHADLVGLRAVDLQGAALGEVVAILNFGAGDLVEIKLVGSGKSELVPLTSAVVPEIDVAEGRIVIAMPETTGDQDSEQS